MSTKNLPGNLIKFRGRTWVILPQENEDIFLLKPLGGSEEEITAVYKPLLKIEGGFKEAHFQEPTVEDIDNFETAQLLFHATRLSFRNAGGPFRCMGKLSFRPRSYQVVPLVMALKQQITRLLIADDVGIGKTVEALMILRERIERGDVSRFAVICPPHLCEQWKKELKDKLDIDADIIRSSTASAIDRKISTDQSVFAALPYQVISIDYIKSERRRRQFLNDCPDFVIVDEAHTCTLPSGATSNTQQLRYHLLNDISKELQRHLLLLTATPHSGKNDEFSALLGLLNPELEKVDLENATPKQRELISRYFIQRKRENIERWLKDKEKFPFPKRDSKELDYELSPSYQEVYMLTRALAKQLTTTNGKRNQYWAALSLLRGIMSSPDAGIEMVRNRMKKKKAIIEIEEEETIGQKLSANSDNIESLDGLEFSSQEMKTLSKIHDLLIDVKKKGGDKKVLKTGDLVKGWLKQKYSPIIFCRYISTAKYLQEALAPLLPSNVHLEAVTSELSDEQRKERIDIIGKAKKKVLIATDCLSEGINLQDNFDAVLHYDLPWNPNRLEQRDGRVDRFGQTKEEVKSYVLWGSDNPMDKIVLTVLLKKVRDIQRTTGVSVSLGEENLSIMDEILKEVLEETNVNQGKQLSLDLTVNGKALEQRFSNEISQIKSKAEKLRSIFAHERVKLSEIETLLKEVDEAIGDVHSVENFVISALKHFGTITHKEEDHYLIVADTLPIKLKVFFPSDLKQIPMSFVSPTPRAQIYIGRNHRFVEQLCQMVMNAAFEKETSLEKVARVASIRTTAVKQLTVLIQFRVRNVIREKSRRNELIAEELFLWGYEGLDPTVSKKTLSYNEVKKLLLDAVPQGDMPLEQRKHNIQEQLNNFEEIKGEFIKLAEERAENLVGAQSSYKTLVGGSDFKAVYPVLPPEVIGVYVLQPVAKKLF
ncbi:helicase-related protein [Flammeovirga sp. EKP202]|uniref:helicase-related protein n=1 Tax=Flammeovirga sp. EKP202 TaxID=2770592 RepID=UPI00165EF850|nr:helicase-related protein [Flammeovirga sp. EKP202]MBD0403240.1 DEAD/DEAH box helicase [Flammeovirga sp. EKP202]